jgi:hypothetical protein
MFLNEPNVSGYEKKKNDSESILKDFTLTGAITQAIV